MPVDPEVFGLRIDRRIHCGTCGYNLYTLPAAGRCPECGSHYNTHGGRREGIFLPEENAFPSSDLATAGLCVCLTAGLVAATAYREQFSWVMAVYTALLGIGTAIAVSVAWGNLPDIFTSGRSSARTKSGMARFPPSANLPWRTPVSLP